MASYNARMTPLRLSVGATAVITAAMVLVVASRRRRPRKDDGGAYESLIGNTPLVKLNRLSNLVGRSIYVKMECLNPGGTGKDRASLRMIQHAEERDQLPPPHFQTTTHVTDNSSMDENKDFHNIISQAMEHSRTGGLVVEGTSGSTGISLAQLCASRGHGCLVVLPDDQAFEKRAILECLGATVHVVKCCAISNPNHYVNVARRLATRANTQENIKAVFINQFENEANFDMHYETTGPELWNQCRMDAFCMSSGTGGTIAGVGRYLKEVSKNACRIVLVDPPGSALWHCVHHGVAYAPQQQERALKRHRYDTLAEGIGLDRITHNFSLGMEFIDDAVRVSDQEAVDMAHWLLRNEGLWVGSSSAMNVTGAVRVALSLKPDSKVVTVICDGGARHVTRFWNRDFCEEWGLVWPGNKQRMPECLQI